MGIAHLLLGSNSGNREQFLSSAIDMIELQVGRVTCKSSVYETEPWGFDATNSFLNQVIRIRTGLSPEETLTRLKAIEVMLGRIRKSGQYESRVIDIDILMFDDLTVSGRDLEIPHPRMHLRKFTLVPMAEISGNLVHPVLKVDMNALNRACSDDLNVQRVRPL